MFHAPRERCVFAHDLPKTLASRSTVTNRKLIESWSPFLFFFPSFLPFSLFFHQIYISFLSREVKSQCRDVSNLSTRVYLQLPLGHAASCFLRIYVPIYSLDYRTIHQCFVVSLQIYRNIINLEEISRDE